MSQITPTSPSTKPSLARLIARWSLIAVFALAAALWIDFARQTLSTDRVQWEALNSPAELVNPSSPDVSTRPTKLTAATTKPKAADDDLPRLLYFTADWCPPCRVLKANIFSKTEVADEIHARFMPYVVDQTQPTSGQLALAHTYNINEIPTLLIVDRNGSVVSRHTGIVKVDVFMTWLDSGWENWNQSRPTALSSESVLTSNQPLP